MKKQLTQELFDKYVNSDFYQHRNVAGAEMITGGDRDYILVHLRTIKDCPTNLTFEGIPLEYELV